MNTVKSGDTVTVHYTGSYENGEIFDTSRVEGREPFSFQVGAQQVIPGFDAGVIGMNIGESKSINIPVEEAYGPIVDEMIIEAPLNVLPEGVEVGTMLQVMSPQGPMIAKIVAINEETQTATVDHNHPLAGQNLNFELELVEIQ